MPKEQQIARLAELEAFKESGYVCGDACTVEGFNTRHTVRCGQFVESMYYTFGSSTSGLKVNVKICCFCCNEKDLVSVEQIKGKIECGGGIMYISNMQYVFQRTIVNRHE